MTKKLEIRDVQYRGESSPSGWSVRYNAQGKEEGWSRLGYEGENAYLLIHPTVFYVDFDRNGVPQRFVSCLRSFEGSGWAEHFGYAPEDKCGWPPLKTEPAKPFVFVETKCNSSEPEPAPAAESLTDITRRFCR